MANAAASPAPQQYTQAMNDQARALIVGTCREMFQQVYSQAVPTPVLGATITIPLRNVGLVKRLLVEVTATVTQGAAEQQSLTPFGLANFFSNISVTDLSNYNRINTSSWHLFMLATLRRQAAYAAAYLNDSPVGIGSNVQVMGPNNPVTAARVVRAFFECPLSYSDLDLRGAVYAAVVNGTWQMQLTINNGFFVANNGDPTLAAYKSSTAQLGALSNVVVTIYQVYLDQIPFSGPNPILPYFDLATGYLLQNTNSGIAPTVNQDYPIQYPNFRQILSTFMVCDNGGTLYPGTDLAYIGIQLANLVFQYKTDPFALALKTRNTIGDDFPTGTYCYESRGQPINTTAYGNTQLVLNFTTVNANANVLIGYEMLGIINQVANAGSLVGN
jgi:hypothetical protein